MAQKFDAVIIGAGMSGLAAGIRLAMFDKKVVIVEKHYVIEKKIADRGQL